MKSAANLAYSLAAHYATS